MATKVKVYTDDLKQGMYVYQLDRPWTETSFMFQGFRIEDQDTIDQLQEACEFVFVDAEQSTVQPEPKMTLKKGPVVEEVVHKKAPKITIKETQYKNPKFSEGSFRESLKRSYGIYQDARGWVDDMLEDSRLGNSIDTKKARSLVVQIADEVIKNPDAMTWLTHLKERDTYTATHCINVCILAVTFGRCLGLDQKELTELGLGALLHDLGKMRVPDKILNKPGRLTDDEFKVMKTHPTEGYKLLRNDESLNKQILSIVVFHHERLDGNGYPKGLKEYEIDPLVRITSIVDVYDAITSDRCYHDGVTPAAAMEDLFKWAEGNFDAQLLQCFIKCLGIYPIGSLVQLNTGDVGVVVTSDEGRRLQPIVMLVMNEKGKHYTPRRMVNLSDRMWEQSGNLMKIVKVLEPGYQGINVKDILMDEVLYTQQMQP